MAKKDPNTYPKGLNRERVQAIIDHYENQTEEEAIAEDEAAFENELTTIEVPRKFAPIVERFIALLEQKNNASV